MTPTDFRALAARVETEAPHWMLSGKALEASGFENDEDGRWYKRRQTEGWDRVRDPGDPLTSVDAAKALLPEGWELLVMQVRDRWAAVGFRSADGTRIEVNAPTEPQARTALALRAMAADLEAKQ